MKVVRCKRCGGRPMPAQVGVSLECRCRLSAWVEVDDLVLFVWDEVAL